MCCFITALLLAGPRLAMLVWWIINPICLVRRLITGSGDSGQDLFAVDDANVPHHLSGRHHRL